MASPFYLVGPTAVGKTSLAVEIASRCGAEIVSADAFQIYAGLDLLTAKPTAEERRRVPHHLVGAWPLETEGSVARFLEQARGCLAAIAARGKPAIVVGGSGLYVKALTHGLSPLPPALPALRAELERWETSRMLDRLRTLDPGGASVIDTRNRRRLIRALEVCEATGQPYSALRTAWESQPGARAGNGFFLSRQRAELHDRIGRRVEALVPAGVLDEVAAQAHTRFSATSEKILGLNDLQAHLRGEIGLPDCLENLKFATRRYAKRQITWFRHQSGFPSVDLSTVDRESLIAESLRRIQMPGEGS